MNAPLFRIEDEAIASLFPLDLTGEIVALRGCIDASTQESGVFSVAAVAFGYDRARKANRLWERVLKGRTFHMTDLNSRRREFEGAERDDVDAIMRGTVSAVRQHASFVIAISCDASLVADSLPVVAARHPDMDHMLAAFRSTYGLMCHLVMMSVGDRANGFGRNPGRNISYVFERGDEGQRGLKKYLDFLGDEPHHKQLLDGYSLNRATIASKEEIEGIFHSSDLVAWEWARHVSRHREGKPMRRSLAELVGHVSSVSDEFGITLSDGHNFFFRHFSAERLGAYLAFFRDTLSATTMEEVEAAFSRYREVYPAS